MHNYISVSTQYTTIEQRSSTFATAPKPQQRFQSCDAISLYYDCIESLSLSTTDSPPKTSLDAFSRGFGEIKSSPARKRPGHDLRTITVRHYCSKGKGTLVRCLQAIQLAVNGSQDTGIEMRQMCLQTTIRRWTLHSFFSAFFFL